MGKQGAKIVDDLISQIISICGGNKKKTLLQKIIHLINVSTLREEIALKTTYFVTFRTSNLSQ